MNKTGSINIFLIKHKLLKKNKGTPKSFRSCSLLWCVKKTCLAGTFSSFFFHFSLKDAPVSNNKLWKSFDSLTPVDENIYQTTLAPDLLLGKQKHKKHKFYGFFFFAWNKINCQRSEKKFQWKFFFFWTLKLDLQNVNV